MVSTVLVGGISPEGEHILNSYLNKFLPDAKVEPLKSVGIKGTMINKASRPDVLLVIIDESLWLACESVAGDILKLDKVHKYTNDDNLTQYLISRFGKLDDTDTVTDSKSLVDDSSSSSYATVEDDHESMIIEEQNETNNEDYENKISELQDKLAQSEMLVKNLTLQLADSKSATDIQPFIDKIKLLEATIAEKEAELQKNDSETYVNLGKVAKAEKVLAEMETLKAELQNTKETCLDLQHQTQVLTEEKEEIQSNYDKLQVEVEELRSTRDNLETLTTSLAEMTDRCAELEAQNSDTTLLQKKLEEVAGAYDELSGVKETLSQKELELENLRVDLDNKTKKIEDLKVKVNDFSSLLDEKDALLQDKEIELDTISKEKETLEETSKEESAQLYEQISSLKENIVELQEKIEKKSLEIADLEKDRNDNNDKFNSLQEELDKLSEKDNEIEELNASLRDCRNTIEKLQHTITELSTNMAAKEGEIEAYKHRESAFQASIENNTKTLSETLEENDSLNDKIKELETEKEKLEGNISTLQESIEQVKKDYEDKVEQKENEIDDIRVEKQKLENEITTLRASVVESKADSDTIQQLNSELLEERRKAARMSSELEVLRNGNNLLSSGDNLVEINKLKKELADTKQKLELAESKDTSSVISNEELVALKQKCADLEIEMVDKTNMLEEYQNGIFGKLANIALPKVAFDIKVDVPQHLTSNCVAIASGSFESNFTMYQNLKRTCSATPDKKYIIVDLVSDTSIDMMFGIKQVNSPIPWLQGSQQFYSFLADTKYPNVKVLSTGLAYINELSFLTVDWVSRITELQNQADMIIFNVGCLNDFVAKVLFTSFCKIMKGHIVVKATPINLRTVILTLTGFKDKIVLNNVLVSCANFDTTQSKQLYQKLVQKCQAQILKDADVLKL